MDLDELQRRWQEQDRKLDASLALNRRVLRTIEMQKVSGALDRLSWLLAFEVAANFVSVFLLGSYLGHRISVLRFALPGAALFAGALALAISSTWQLARLRTIDYNAPVVVIQERLESVRLVRLGTTRWTLLLATLAWTPLMIVVLDALLGRFGVDVYRILGWRYIAANLLVGVAIIPLLSWMARRSIWKRFTRHFDGRNLTAARQWLASIAAFEAGTSG